MTSREKEGIAQFFNEGAVLNGSLRYKDGQGNEKYNIVEFALPDVHVAFQQEDIIELQIKTIAYKLLVLKMEHKGDCYVVRGLVKSEEVRGDKNALGS